MFTVSVQQLNIPFKLYEGTRIDIRIVVLQEVMSHGSLFSSSGQKRKKKSNMKRGLDIIPGNWGKRRKNQAR
jgi:hypothetical protein